jgi:hypothetical protein
MCYTAHIHTPCVKWHILLVLHNTHTHLLHITQILQLHKYSHFSIQNSNLHQFVYQISQYMTLSLINYSASLINYKYQSKVWTSPHSSVFLYFLHCVPSLLPNGVLEVE